MLSCLEREEGKTVIYTSIGSDWKRFGHPRRYLQSETTCILSILEERKKSKQIYSPYTIGRKRPLHSVILEEGISQFLLQDIQQFLLKANWCILKINQYTFTIYHITIMS